MSDIDAYIKSLLVKGYGYPLWSPEPTDEPTEYRQHGVRVGDVGILTDQGAFDYLFTIVAERNDSRNSMLMDPMIANDAFTPLHVRPHGIRRQDAFDRHHCISTESISKSHFDVSAHVTPPGVGTLSSGMKIASSSEGGVALLLPNGASSWHYVLLDGFRTHVRSHGLGLLKLMEKLDGPSTLYLITGCHKSSAWGITLSVQHSETTDVSIEFLAHEIAGGKLQYSWEESSTFKSSHAGPRARPKREKSNENQCIFIRGIKIAKRGTPIIKYLKPISVKAVDGSRDVKSAIRENRSETSPSSGGSSSDRTQSSSGGGANEADSALSLEDIGGTSMPYHPSTAIIEYLFKEAPNAELAIVDDEEWMSILLPSGEADEFPEDKEIVRRVLEKYNIRQLGQCVFLEMPAPSKRGSGDSVTGVLDFKSEQENLVSTSSDKKHLQDTPSGDKGSGDLDNLNSGVSRLEAAVSLTPDAHPDKPAQLSNLGNLLGRHFEQLGDLDDLNKSVLRFEAAVALTPDGHSGKPGELNNLGHSLLGRFERLGDLSDIDKSVLMLEDAVQLTPDGHPDKPALLNNLGNSLLARFERLGDLSDINKSVLMLEDAVQLTPDGHPGKPEGLNNLGHSLLGRFERLGDLSDINKSVLMLEDAVALTPDGHPGKPGRLNNLGNSLSIHFQRLGNLSDINKSVLMLEDAVQLTTDGHPHKPSLLNNLGEALFRRFERLGDLSDINKSVLMLEDAVQLTPDGHPGKPEGLNNLGHSLLGRFERLGDLSDINKSVLMLEDAVALTPDGHPGRPRRLNNLGNSLSIRFQRLGNLSDINKSVLMLEDAVQLTTDGHPHKPSLLNNLGEALFRRFERLGDLSDINKSVLMLEDAVQLTTDGHPHKPSLLNNLGEALFRRFERLGDLSNINKSVLILEDAVQLTPDGHPDKPSRLNNLGNLLLIRFQQLGDLSDINKSVLMLENAVQLTPDGHPDKPSRLNNLGNSLLIRFQRLGNLSDINKSVLMLEDAVQLTPDGHPHKPSLFNNLGESLFRRFERLDDLDDLNQSALRFEAAVGFDPTSKILIPIPPWLLGRFAQFGDIKKSVLVLEDAVRLTPDGHPDKPSRLNNLGRSLVCRFERLGDLSDINKSVLMFEDAVKLTPDGHPDKPSRLNNLGGSLVRRFERLGDLSNINKSVLMFEDAVKLTPDGHPDKPSRLNNLGNSLLGRFERLHDPKDSQELLRVYTLSARSTTGSANIRFDAATRWAKHAHLYQPLSLPNAYTTAMKILPELVRLGLSMTDRHYRLLTAGQVVRDTASAAIAVGDYQKAVEWLDQGRSIIWGQLLNLRTPVDELRKSHSGLANELVSLSTALETAGTWSNAVADDIEPQSLQSIANDAHAFALKRNHILQQIRELPRFESFLLPKPISELSSAAKNGPVAIINVSEYGCDALILMPGLADEVIHVPLKNFTLHEVQALAESLASIVGTTGHSDRAEMFRERDMAPDDVFSDILSELWFKIVQPVLNGIALTTPVHQNLGRIWWCPTGPLAFLPIHAAGLYGKDQAFGAKLSDFLISSYTPSLTALIQGHRPQSESQAGTQLLAVTQSSAEGQSFIPGTLEEIKCIEQHAKGKVPVLWLDRDMATIEEVQKGMKDSRWVHFACHGLQDESVHLTAGMLLAGYRGVIGTMWSIGDNDAPQVAGDVYAHLLEASPPDPARAAEALHLAVQKLREQSGGKKSFLHWVPFIHVGV
ncbi:hypothetical protein B0H16DRAFT_1695911 [Mycena metata]|uniref:CHAT domain-containing protein n=1 Tax=Mycena metata TaxID=1033252 RepID=A0AAD7I393_9AGAR|nr:hypothetical protein B0H16DRAFT_1695911 [Mycena metata]